MSYDGLDRLTQTNSPMFGTASYAYDGQDNLTRVQVTGGSQARDHDYCYTASNQLAFVRSGPACTGTTSPAVVALAYDAQGNLSVKNGASYAFDYGNRLRTTAGQNYRYDAAGRRVRQDVAGSQLQYSQYASDGRLVWQRDEVAGKRITNVYLDGSLLAELSRPLTGNTTTISYLHTDALGSPIAKTNATGAIIETSEYEPYGRLLNRANDNRAGYTGHVMDASSGLTYMQQRYYDPGIGRFLSVDPVTAYSNPVGAFNRYWYANNNPYRFTDPDGREIRVANLADRARIEKMINSLAVGVYRFNNSGQLQQVRSTGDNSHFSSYYSDRLNQAIASDKTINISIGSTYADPDGKQYPVKGGMTQELRSGDQDVVITGQSYTGDLRTSTGSPLTESPAFILAHELVGHAIPAIVGSDTGNAISNENKIRIEIPDADLREALGNDAE